MNFRAASCRSAKMSLGPDVLAGTAAVSDASISLDISISCSFWGGRGALRRADDNYISSWALFCQFFDDFTKSRRIDLRCLFRQLDIRKTKQLFDIIK